MRILFGIIPAPAHLLPVVPLAWAFQSAGHEVRIVSHPQVAGAVQAAGLFPVPLADDVDLRASSRSAAGDERLEAVVGALPMDEATRDLRSLLKAYMMAPFAYHYTPAPPGGARPMTDELVRFARYWKPELVLWDPLFFPAPVAARASGAAHARLLWGQDYVGWMRQTYREQLRRSGGEPGGPSDAMAAMMEPQLRRFGQRFDEELLLGQWTVDPTPDALRLPVETRSVPVRWTPYHGPAEVPEWLRTPPQRPRVCISLGMSGRAFLGGTDLASELFEAVAGLDIEVVATLNQNQLEGQAAGQAVPENVRLIDYLPLNLLLPTCSAIIHHGGNGTVMAALHHRVPQLAVPSPDPFALRQVRHVADSGAGLVLDSAEVSAGSLREGLLRLLGDPAFQQGADRLHAAAQAVPGPAELVPVLTEMAEKHRPESTVF
ncbi:activator-dependent family glycosyltransferase [Streptomyces sp. HNM0574]|uniref:activator-dependent family glycosyltransferase n=1 Tax=Streptomyces sp. HNM0574 TaxID=2714954 RepID=UPI00146BE68A|nr:activator-dependent family glycosyltransferase [Streptomyces sp. HNM0574]NLU68554.1 activator-dependent family glycosyltransferase [Streptomyces sp. HNM0574]